MKRIAFYGGSFDPLHCGHLTIARALTELFELDEFVFVPAFHAPHKKDKRPTSAFHRYAMIALATEADAKLKVSKMELDVPQRPYTIETLTRLKSQMPEAQIFFVMGADSWQDITTWRDWEKVLTCVNIIVVTRPDYEIGFSHVTGEILERIVDLRNSGQPPAVGARRGDKKPTERIYITDVVQIDVSATEIRQNIKGKGVAWRRQVPEKAADYIEKYELYI